MPCYQSKATADKNEPQWLIKSVLSTQIKANLGNSSKEMRVQLLPGLQKQQGIMTEGLLTRTVWWRSHKKAENPSWNTLPLVESIAGWQIVILLSVQWTCTINGYLIYLFSGLVSVSGSVLAVELLKQKITANTHNFIFAYLSQVTQSWQRWPLLLNTAELPYIVQAW